MHQEIVISPRIANFFYSYDQFDFGSKQSEFLKKLFEEIIVVDDKKKWFIKFNSYLSNNPNKHILQQIIVRLNDKNKIKSVNYDNKIGKNQLSDEELRFECNLAIKTYDKIIIHPEISDFTKKIIKLQLDVEIADIDNYLNPQNDSRIISEMKYVQLKPGEFFDIPYFFKNYCSRTRYLIIQDGYLFNKNGSWRNFREFLKVVKNETNIKIITLEDDARNKFAKIPDGFKAKEALTSLFKERGFRNFKIELKKNKKEIHARFIETEHFLIHLDRGFDFIRLNKQKKWVTTEGLITILSKKQ